MYHLPVGYPFATGTGFLLTSAPSHRFFHAAGNPFHCPNRNIRFHSSLPEGKVAVEVGRINRATDSIFVVFHVAVGHGDGFDIGVDKALIPLYGVGYAIDVIPSPGVVAGKMLAQCSPDFHQLEGGFQLLDQDIDFDRAYRQTQVRL